MVDAPVSEAPTAPAELPAEEPAGEAPTAPRNYPPKSRPARPHRTRGTTRREPASEAPTAPAEPPAEEPASEAPTAPAEPPAEEPASEAPTPPAEPPAEPPASEAPAAPRSDDSIVVIKSAVNAPSIVEPFSVPFPDSPARAVIDGEGSASRPDPHGASPLRLPFPIRNGFRQGLRRRCLRARGASGGSGGGFSGGFFAVLVGFLILMTPGLGQVLNLSLSPRAPTLVAGIERPD